MASASSISIPSSFIGFECLDFLNRFLTLYEVKDIDLLNRETNDMTKILLNRIYDIKHIVITMQQNGQEDQLLFGRYAKEVTAILAFNRAFDDIKKNFVYSLSNESEFNKTKKTIQELKIVLQEISISYRGG